MTIILKRNDSDIPIPYTLVYDDGSPVILSGCSVVFTMGKMNKMIINKPATIVNTATGEVEYVLQDDDTLIAGEFLAEFAVTFPDGRIQTFPSESYLSVKINANLDNGLSNVVIDEVAKRQGDFTTKLDLILAQATGNANAEVVAARGISATVGARLNSIDTSVSEKVKKGTLFFDVTDYGAVGDGVVDNTTFIQAAEAATVAAGTDARLIIPRGLYKTTGTIKIRCALDADQATIRYYGTGTALVIGDDATTGIVTARRRYHLPRVINMLRVSGWDGTSIGVKCVNLNDCNVFVSFIQDFEKGLVVYGYSQGTAYSNFYLGTMWENHKNIVLEGDATGWVNQNTFIGGRLQLSLTKGATADDMNAKLIDMSSTIQPNNNTFVGTSIEGANVCYYRVDISGRHNTFYNCRWESQSAAIVRVRYRPSAYANKIDGGYDAAKIEETFDAGSLGGGEIRDSLGAYVSAFATSGQSIPHNTNTAINTWNTPVGRRFTYNGTTGEFTPRAGRWKITATACFAPNATGRRFMILICNGAARDIFEVPANAGRVSMKVEDVFKFDGTQTFYFQVFHNSGSPLLLETTSGYVKMQAEYLGY